MIINFYYLLPLCHQIIAVLVRVISFEGIIKLNIIFNANNCNKCNFHDYLEDRNCSVIMLENFVVSIKYAYEFDEE